jgi:hypothetical protein
MCLAEKRMSVWAGSIFQVLTAVASGQVVDEAMIRRWAPSIAQAGVVPTERDRGRSSERVGWIPAGSFGIVEGENLLAEA